MKSFLTTLLFILLGISMTHAQFEYQSMVDKGKESKALKKALKAYSKNPESIQVNYNLGVLYNLKAASFHQVDSAYRYGTKTLELLTGEEQKEIDRAYKNNLDEKNIDVLINEVCRTALDEAKAINEIDVYNHFLEVFTFNEALVSEATVSLHKRAFELVDQVSTVESYQSFINSYPEALQLELAKKKRNKIAFDQASEAHTILGYQTFIDSYPNADEIKEAKYFRDELAFEQAKTINTSEAMRELLRKYPNSELRPGMEYERDKLDFTENVIPNSASSTLNYLKNHPTSSYEAVIVDSLYHIGLRQNDFYSLKYLAEYSTEYQLHDSIWLDYYNVYCRSGSYTIIDEFESEYSYQFPYSSFLDKSYLDALSIEILDDEEIHLGNEEIHEYFQMYPESYMSFLLVQEIVEPYLKSKNWTKANSVIDRLQEHLKKRNLAVNDLQNLINTGDKNIKKRRLSSVINTSKGGEYVPVISADNELLYFCGINRHDNYMGEDIFVSENRNGQWSKPKIIDELSSYENDAPLSVSTDGNTLLTFISGDLFYSERRSYGWSEPIRFPYPVNSSTWDADLMITSDGKSVLFASARESDHPTLLPIDIYVSHKISGGWSEPLSLGSTINTEFSDRMPYLHSDMKTLYFASNGHGGLGGMDVFMTTRLNDSTWTDWSKPVNLGREINTVNKDWGYKISTDGKQAYFAASDSKGNNDIHVVNLPNYLRPGFVATIEGVLKDKNEKPIEATIIWEDLETGKTIGESKSNPADGTYFIVLPMGKIYGYYIDNGDYFPVSNNLDLREEETALEIEHDLELVTFEEMIEEGIAVPMNNLFFNKNKSNLLPESKPELERIAKIISLNKLKVEIAGHTDNSGTDEHNQELSENRANSVYNHLVLLGVSEELMTTVGYGEHKPNATNETEKGKALNRRVELRFIE
jgi:outer membrane protein OmpA-like peptidoglycan-associated protein